MSDWPALEQELHRSAARLYGRRAPRVRPLLACAVAAAALAFVAARAFDGPRDERAAAPPVTSGPLARYAPVPARVVARDASAARIDIDRGSVDGIHRGDPVVADGALIGRVRSVSASAAAVMLVTDPLFSVAARAGAARVYGIAEPTGSGRLALQLARHPEAVKSDDRVYTAGTPSSRPDLRSAYPAGLLIGTVTHVDPGTGELDRVIHIAPAARLDDVADVQVLTRPQGR